MDGTTFLCHACPLRWWMGRLAASRSLSALRSPATTFCLTLWSPANQNVEFTYSLAPIEMPTRHQDLTSLREPKTWFQSLWLYLHFTLLNLGLREPCLWKHASPRKEWRDSLEDLTSMEILKTKHWKNQPSGKKDEKSAVWSKFWLQCAESD